LTHIPLLVFMPGQTERIDFHSLTATIDVMPTLLRLAGKTIPDWVEGDVLPPFNPNPDPDKLVFGIDLRHNPKESPFTNGTGMVCYGDYKLTHIFGSEAKYEPLSGEMYEFYNLAEDPEELNNLHTKLPDIEDELMMVLDKGIKAVESSA
jgi:arylsulfatase A-like enzyme